MRASPLVAFPTTHWSEIDRARDGGEETRLSALGELLRRYLPALRSYLRNRHRLSEADADDLLQAFIVGKMLEQDLVSKADRARGEFRSLLMVTLDRFLIDELRRRGTGAAPSSIPEVSDEIIDPSPGPAAVFDMEWARQVVKLAVESMRRECEAGGRADIWAVFDARVLGPKLDGIEPVPLDVLVQRLGLSSPEQASNLLATGKRMLARNLRSIVGEYADGPAELEEELRALRAILAQAGA